MKPTKGCVCPAILTCTLCFIVPAYPSDFTQLTKEKPNTQNHPHKSHPHSSHSSSLPMGIVLDSQGNPISLPPEQNALNFSSAEMLRDESTAPYANQQTKNTPGKTQLTASTKTKKVSTANDPSCRWLANRIKQLSKQIKQHSETDYFKTELSHRQEEWQCMDCEGAGPAQGQQDECQYRR